LREPCPCADPTTPGTTCSTSASNPQRNPIAIFDRIISVASLLEFCKLYKIELYVGLWYLHPTKMADSQSVEVTVQLVQNDLYRANIAITWRRYKLYQWLILCLGMGVAAGSLFGLLFSQTTGFPARCAGALFGILFVPVFLVAMVYSNSHTAAKSLMRNTPALQGPTRWTFSETGIKTDGPTAHAELQWNSFLQVRETREQFLLYPQKHLAKVIPKRCFSSEIEIDRFRELVRRRVPTASSRQGSK